jgi:hypothetical protein
MSKRQESISTGVHHLQAAPDANVKNYFSSRCSPAENLLGLHCGQAECLTDQR